MQGLRQKYATTFHELIWKEVRSQGWRFFAYFSVISLAGAASIAPPKFYGFFAENVEGFRLMSQASANEFIQQLLIFGAILAVTLFICNVVRSITEEWISLHIEASLRCRFMTYMQRMPLEKFDESQRGDWLTRMSQDIHGVEQFISLRLPQQIFDLIVTVGISVLFLTQNFWIALILLSSATFIAVINFYIQHSITPMLENLRDLHGQVFQGLLESFEGLRSIRSYKAEGFVLQIFQSRVHSIIDKGLSMIRIVGTLVGTNSFLVNLLTTGILTLVAIKLRGNQILLSDVFLYPFYIGMFYASVFALVRGVFDWNDFFVHARRLQDVFQVGSQNTYTQQSHLSSSTFDRIEIQGVSVGYQGFAKLTRPFDFSVQKGEITVIRGHSGCGKSTFLEMLAGLRSFDATSVQLYHQNKLAQDLTDLTNSMLLSVDFATYVEQRPYLLEGSLRSNLALGQDISDSQLWSALHDVNMSEFFKERDGLSFFIQDDGRNLSEGQKQRVGIARSLVNLRPLLLLDEPFASLDHEAIHILCKALNKLKEQHGIVIITHMIPETLDLDRIVDFDSFSTANENPEKTLDTEDFIDPCIANMILASDYAGAHRGDEHEVIRAGANNSKLLADELVRSPVDCRVFV